MISHAENDFAQEENIEYLHPYSVVWNTVWNDEKHYKCLVSAHRLQCVGTYC